MLPAEPPEPTDPPAADAAATKGKRLQADWRLPKPWGQWALDEFPGWTEATVRDQAARFADFWRAKTGKDATKADWEATWRNWCRNAKSPVGIRASPGAPAADLAAETARLLGFARAPDQNVIDA